MDHFKLSHLDYPGVTEADCQRAFYQAIKEFTPVPPQEIRSRYVMYMNRLLRDLGYDYTPIVNEMKKQVNFEILTHTITHYYAITIT
jgi:hypothetical protein